MAKSLIIKKMFSVLTVILMGALFLILSGCAKENIDYASEALSMEVPNGEAALILEKELYDVNGIVRDGEVYLKVTFVQELFNKGFYWDEAEQVLSYVVPEAIIRAYPGEKAYLYNNGIKEMNVAPIIVEHGTCYMSATFCGMFSNVRFSFYEKPDRLIINYKWDEFLEYSVNDDEAYLHVSPDITSEVWRLLPKNTKLYYISGIGKSDKDFVKVMTSDGVYGYVQLKHLSESYYNKLTSDFTEPTRWYKAYKETVKMGWHYIGSVAANDTLDGVLKGSEGMNVISPTWFTLKEIDGTFESRGSAEYVKKAHDAGIKVWPLVENMTYDVSSFMPLSSTKTREVMEDSLISETLSLGADGINIDFEALSLETGVHFVQFIKELAVKCHYNGLVLSVDDYVPPYKAHYDLETQGEFADYVILMAYDEHYSGSAEAGSVSSIGFVTNALTDCLKMVSAEHIIVGMPFYTRIWKESSTGLESEACSMDAAADFINRNNLKTKWDSETAQNYAECLIAGTKYRVWLEDVQSVAYKLQAVSASNVGGVAFWRLGQESDGIWDIINQYTK